MKIGIDIGGSHIGIGLVESNGNIIVKKEKTVFKININTPINKRYLISLISI